MTQTPAAASGLSIDHELALLEEKLATLVAHTRALRAANVALRRDLATAYDRNRTLAERVSVATERLDALLARLPEDAG